MSATALDSLPMTDSQAAAEPAVAVPSRLRLVLRSPVFLVGAVVLLFWIGCALFGPSLVPYPPYADDLLHTLAPPSAAHWFGTDQLGRDIFSRVIVGARPILSVAPAATLLATVAGATLGLLTGYVGGWLDAVIGRLIEVLLALPLIVVALLVLVALGPSSVTVIAVIGVIFTPLIARTVRAAVLAERSHDYVAAAELRGEGALHIMFVEILPNVLPPILVETTVRLGYAIFTVASLSFLGFGIQPPSADWGLAISENYGMITGGYWWTVAFAAGATASLVVGVNLVADGIQAALE
ncbi:MAG TPA: ABC transporter permease [Acetobacteraceae bacterium]